ncbi:MAG TPA: hypothetical protein DCS07_14190 [Bdellovibrionales bacterium]|nr:MAG: hypothetical protein A2Z97_01160 [Bdellovibrionales bacterium GWB1_52_6]OFZ05431.1 MAG: hypothetical protein A2X97_11160 [Bdellovibrionales bacterium GWA1_52_35]OFZ41452.1 MAG: hypothetical protein A2070_01570 [Bdellovibrionales bacterium GWC1_52_8]HAR43761.1 hypothetical protein [Bdellovibrionales bacterium]HCM39207.1 hypothetical protein [Bdellovibrionales bacterium]
MKLIFRSSSNHGFSIVGTMVASGMMGILMLSTISMFNYHNKTIQGLRTVSSKDGLKSLLDRSSVDATAIMNSAAHAANINTMFDWCVSGATTCASPPCCVAGVSYPFTLVDSAPVPNIIAGTQANPALFSTEGISCAEVDSSCLLAVHASFVPECEGASPCASAKRITISYTIKHADGAPAVIGARINPISRSSTVSLPFQSGIGQANRLAKWTSPSTLGVSGVNQDPVSGYLGIGTTNAWDQITLNSENAWIALGTPGTVSASQAAGMKFFTIWDGKDMGSAGSNNKGFKVYTPGDANTSDPDVNGDLVFAHWNGTEWKNSLVLDSGAARNVGIFKNDPLYALDVTGDVRTEGCIQLASGTIGTCTSDRRLKKNIRAFSLGLKALEGVEPKFYRYNGLGGNPVSEADHLGVIAQDLEKTAPELVTSRPGSEYKSVNYSGLIYVVINSLKELHFRWRTGDQNHERDLVVLQTENARLAAKLEKLKANQLEVEKRISQSEGRLNE